MPSLIQNSPWLPHKRHPFTSIQESPGQGYKPTSHRVIHPKELLIPLQWYYYYDRRHHHSFRWYFGPGQCLFQSPRDHQITIKPWGFAEGALQGPHTIILPLETKLSPPQFIFVAFSKACCVFRGATCWRPCAHPPQGCKPIHFPWQFYCHGNSIHNMYIMKI